MFRAIERSCRQLPRKTTPFDRAELVWLFTGVGVRGVSLGCFLHVLCGQRVVALGVVRVLGSLFIVALGVVLCGLLVVLGRLGVVLCCWVCRHLIGSCPVSGCRCKRSVAVYVQRPIIPTSPKGDRTVYSR